MTERGLESYAEACDTLAAKVLAAKRAATTKEGLLEDLAKVRDSLDRLMDLLACGTVWEGQ